MIDNDNQGPGLGERIILILLSVIIDSGDDITIHQSICT